MLELDVKQQTTHGFVCAHNVLYLYVYTVVDGLACICTCHAV